MDGREAVDGDRALAPPRRAAGPPQPDRPSRVSRLRRRARATRVSVPGEVLQFAGATLVVVLLLAAVGSLVIQRNATTQATSTAETVTRVDAQGVVQPVLQDRLLTGDRTAIVVLDGIVRQRVLSDRVVRVKLWKDDGTIVYSDEPRLIGHRFQLGHNELAALRSGSVDEDVSDLTRPENRFDGGHGQLLEVYLPVHTPDHRVLLFETYQESGVIRADERRIRGSFLPVVMGGLLLLFLAQLPLAWRLARRLEQGRREREALLHRALRASDAERRRIAGDLHDGVVQQLAGMSLSLSAAAGRLRGGASAADEVLASAEVMERASLQSRAAVGDLRTLIVEIAPRSLTAATLPSLLEDLVAPLRAQGVHVELDAQATTALSTSDSTLVFRVAQELIRNVAAHAGARSVRVRLEQGQSVLLRVEDDGRGFTPGERELRREEGHIGLSLLHALVADAGSQLSVRSSSGHGTQAVLTVPVR